jgi:hypothetical protein
MGFELFVLFLIGFELCASVPVCALLNRQDTIAIWVASFIFLYRILYSFFTINTTCIYSNK